MGFLAGIWDFFVRVYRSLLPTSLLPTEMVLTRARAGTELYAEQLRFARFRTIVRWVVHVLLVVAVVIVLWLINRSLDLERVLRSPLRSLHSVWLPLLFLTGYVLCWLGWWVLRLLAPTAETADFPDIDAAWDEALKALEGAGIEPSEVPLFLVVGRPARSTEDLFDAAQWPLQVRHAPRQPDAPLHVYANREAIFITCEGASLLGRAAALLAEEKKEIAPSTEMVESKEAEPGVAGAEPSPAAEPSSKSAGLQLLEPEPATNVRRLALSHDVEQTDRLTGRLRYLCRLISRRREPYCGANGILLLIPLAAASDAENAEEAAVLCQGDLLAAREALRVRCPVLALVCDGERLPGFDELLRQFPNAEQRRQAVGVRLPLRPRIEEAGVPAMIEDGLAWVAQSLLPTNAFRLFRADVNGDGVALAVNSGLARVIGEVMLCQPHVSRILTEGIAAVSQGAPLLGGCYLGATGPDAAREQGFVHAVLRQLVEGQNAVAWTDAALAEEADYRRLARWASLGVLVAVGFLCYLVFLVWYS